jgi:hypothetical protein
MTNKIFNKLNHLIIISLALTCFMMSGCEANIERPDDEAVTPALPRVIHLAINQNSLRSIDTPIGEKQPVEFDSGDLYLVNAAGMIVRHFEITGRSSGIVTDRNSGVINRAELDKAFTITEVDASVTQIAIAGNTAGNYRMGSFANMNRRLIDVFSQQSANSVNTIGVGRLRLSPVLDNGSQVYNCVINVVPTVARIEITDITGADNIASFSVEGIFVNNFYVQGHVSGEMLTNLSNRRGLPTNNINNFTPTSTPGLLNHWHGTGTGSLASVDTPRFGGRFPVASPGAGNVWSFQIFAEPQNSNSTPTEFPDIVFRIGDIQLKDGTSVTGSRLVVLRDFIHQSANAGRLGMHAGNVYHIPAQSIIFGNEILTQTRGMELRSVSVEIY